MKKTLILLFLFSIFNSYSQSNESEDSKNIKKVLLLQQTAWSNNNLDEFMEGYWKSDSLKFYGSNGITYGWKNTLAIYKKAYPTKKQTGTLDFKINAITKITEGAYYLLGAYYLTREVGNTNGIFMLIFKKIDGEWKIIADTSS